MLIAKGYDVFFKMLDGRTVRAPRPYALLHDSKGQDWPSCSALVAPFVRTGGLIRNKDEAEKYFGYEPRAGRLVMPTRRISEWSLLGEAVEIDYWRPGEEEGDFFHPFTRTGGWWIFKTGEYPLVYRLNGMLRAELGGGCDWTDRGFVSP